MAVGSPARRPEPGATPAQPERASGAQLVSLEGRHALVTGAASGIGLAIARRFADAGARLVLVDRDAHRLGVLESELSKSGVAATTHVVDLTGREQIRDLWGALDQSPPDTLINNAGSYPMRDFLELESDDAAKVLDLNLLSALWMSQEMIRRRRRAGGVIVNVSSVEALIPFRDDLIHYAAAKAGVLALTRSLAHAYARWGFRVNAVVPGAIRTPGTASLRKKAITNVDLGLVRTGLRFQSRLPAGSWGDPDDVARVALFLASGLARYVHGAAIPVDGGFLSA